MTATDRRPTASRRAVLAGVGGTLAAGGLAASAGAQAAEAGPSVMTRNCYLGVDLFRLLRAETAADVRRIAGRLLADVRSHPYERRAAAIADELARHRPDVVGIQEAALIRTQRPGDFEEAPEPNAGTVVVDFLESLSAAIEERDLPYRAVGTLVTNDVEVPAAVDGERVDVRLTDRLALLVHRDVAVDAVRTATFEAAFEVPLEGATISLDRGYSMADVRVDGTAFTVATTHLEAVLPSVRQSQADALAEALPSDRPVVLAGDVNDGPATSGGAYDRLTGPLADAHSTLAPATSGFTCCQAEDLRNERSRLTRRIDAMLYRGLEPRSIERVGEDPGNRVPLPGGAGRTWPSDHAGVLVRFAPGATAATPEPTQTPTATESPTTESPTTAPRTSSPTTGPVKTSTEAEGTGSALPGFGPVVAVAGLLVAVLARLRRAT